MDGDGLTGTPRSVRDDLEDHSDDARVVWWSHNDPQNSVFVGLSRRLAGVDLVGWVDTDPLLAP